MTEVPLPHSDSGRRHGRMDQSELALQFGFTLTSFFRMRLLAGCGSSCQAELPNEGRPLRGVLDCGFPVALKQTEYRPCASWVIRVQTATDPRPLLGLVTAICS